MPTTSSCDTMGLIRPIRVPARSPACSCTGPFGGAGRINTLADIVGYVVGDADKKRSDVSADWRSVGRWSANVAQRTLDFARVVSSDNIDAWSVCRSLCGQFRNCRSEPPMNCVLAVLNPGAVSQRAAEAGNICGALKFSSGTVSRHG